MHQAAPTTPQSSYHRLQHPESQLYVRLSWKFTESGKPIVRAFLTRRDRASRFPSHAAAVEAFASYIGVAPLEIVRCDA